MRLNKIIVLLGLIGVTMGSPIYGEGIVKRVDMMSEINQSPILYRGSLYGLTKDTQILSKINSQGQFVWQLSAYKEDPHSFNLKFDRIFILSKTGGLSSYNAKYGFHLWSNNTLSITNFKIVYPYIYYLSLTGELGCLDFNVGNVIWTLKDQNLVSFFTDIFSKQIIGLSKENELLQVDQFSGAIRKQSQLKPNVDEIIGSLSDKIYFENGNGLYQYQLRNSKLKSLNEEVESGGFLDGQFYINLSMDKDKWYSFDLQKNKFKWKKPLLNEEGKEIKVVYGRTKLLTISDDLVGNLYDYKSGEVYSKSFSIENVSTADFKAADLLSFEEIGNKIVLVFKKAIFMVIPEKLN